MPVATLGEASVDILGSWLYVLCVDCHVRSGLELQKARYCITT